MAPVIIPSPDVIYDRPSVWTFGLITARAGLRAYGVGTNCADNGDDTGWKQFQSPRSESTEGRSCLGQKWDIQAPTASELLWVLLVGFGDPDCFG